MDGNDLISLAAGPLELAVAPAVGGSIAAFDFFGPAGRVAILRGARRVPPSVLDAGSFPLVPFVNRIRDGAFRFRGREVTLAPNMAGDPSPLHGQGWLSPWQVVGRSGTSAELRFDHEAGEWPWDYEAHQHIALDEAGVTIDLHCINRSAEPMPCGLGQHPYFPCTADTVLDTVVRTAWTIDEYVLPVEEVPAEGRFDLRGRRVCGQGLDHGFGGWGGRATIATAGLPFTLAMSSPDAAFFQLYSPADGGLFVAEPVSHANAGLNAPEPEWPGLGMRVLRSGEAMSLSMRIDVVPAEAGDDLHRARSAPR